MGKVRVYVWDRFELSIRGIKWSEDINCFVILLGVIFKESDRNFGMLFLFWRNEVINVRWKVGYYF